MHAGVSLAWRLWVLHAAAAPATDLPLSALLSPGNSVVLKGDMCVPSSASATFGVMSYTRGVRDDRAMLSRYSVVRANSWMYSGWLCMMLFAQVGTDMNLYFKHAIPAT
jgi:hypothetical protein